MNEFAGMEELMGDFLTEASDLLSDVDSKLIELEKAPHDRALLNVIFRGFHTIKGGAGFLNATELVSLCHLTENLFDKLRNGELTLNTPLMDAIFAATGEVRQMFNALAQSRQPSAASAALMGALHDALREGGNPPADPMRVDYKITPAAKTEYIVASAASLQLDWNVLYEALVRPVAVEPAADVAQDVMGAEKTAVFAHSVPETLLPAVGPSAAAPPELSSLGRRAGDIPGAKVLPTGRRESDAPKDNTIRVDTDRLDQVLNLSGEIGLTKNRLTHLRSEILQGRMDEVTLRVLDDSIGQLDTLVVDLQNAVMKTRMQPIGRLFNKYPRIARDLARQLGKDVELVLSGEDTEIDKTTIEDLNDPLIHLIRNAVDHGVEDPAERAKAGKPEKSVITLSAHQEGDHIFIAITDDGKGMSPEVIRNRAVEKELLSAEAASSLDAEQSLNLILLPGFSTKEQVSSVSGRGVGMDVVKTNIQKLKGAVTIASELGKGSKFTISLPLTLAILPVLILRLHNQSFAVPLLMVREILSITSHQLQQVSGKATMVVRGEVLPVLPLARLIGWEPSDKSEVGVLLRVGANSFVLSAEGFGGQDDVVIKSLDTFRPKGVAGVTMSSEGEIVLILDIRELLDAVRF
jgi:two-component system chemotaxis sensor kinase CheA